MIETYECSQERLWSVLTDDAQLSAWLGGPCSIEPRVGGHVRLTVDGVSATGQVRSFEPPRAGRAVAMLEHTFVDDARPSVTTVCRWAVVDHGGGTELRFTHDGTDDPFGGVRDRLADVVEPLRDVRSALLVSFIGDEVPLALLDAGVDVFAKVGPGPSDWAHAALVADGTVEWTSQPGPPEHVDLVHLDWDDFDTYLAVAVELGAHTIWHHSARTEPPASHDDRGTWLPAAQSMSQRAKATAAGLRYVDSIYLPDAIRRR